MPFRILSSASAQDTLGQSWLGDEWDENIRLCDYQTIRTVFSDLLPKDGKILEAGCGLGRWVFYLRQKGFDVIGLEASSQAFSVIREHDPEGYIKEGDVRSMPFDDGSFQALISLGVMEHFEEGPQKLLLESNRVLKKGGLLFVSIPPNTLVRKMFLNPVLSLKYSIKKMLGKKLAFAEYRSTEKEFTPFIKESGFEIQGVYTDELDPPRNIGLYIDFPRLQSPEKHWKLNGAGLMINKTLTAISPALHRGGVLFVCRKE
jgi:SAM-dependent methyltransferase